MRTQFFCSFVLLSSVFSAWSQQPAAQEPAAQQADHNYPILHQRPPAQPRSLVIRDGKIKLDAVVTDAAGKPVTGLQPWDFKLLDDGKPRRIQSFRSFDGTLVKPDPPAEVILVMDMVNLPFQQVAFVRDEVERFLRQNNGHLAQPTTLIVFNNSGLHILPRPTLDGNGLAGLVKGLEGSIRSIDSAQGTPGLLERAELSVRQMATIAENEARKPGRKLLVWLGWGWPMLDRHKDNYTEKDQRQTFDLIVELATRLREGRVAVYCVIPFDSSLGYDAMYTRLYESFLNPVRTPQDADLGNLALKVLVTQTGGLILGPDNDLAGQLNRCVADANAFYTLSFDPPKAAQADEFHDLKLLVNTPGLTVRTNAGYYNQP